ncbi:MAG: DUF1801 domain-containing protein [Flavobacteriales bacterium]
MAKAELKTKETKASVDAFIERQPEEVRADCHKLVKLMTKATGEGPRMWGTSIIGFGRYTYEGKSGRSGEWMVTGFSPRKANLSIHILMGFEKEAALMKKLGKHSTGKGCLYIKQLADVDMKLLEQLVVKSVKAMAKLRVK